MIVAVHCIAGDFRLDLHDHDNFMIVSIENLSAQDIKVSTKFTQNPAFGLIRFNVLENGHGVGFKSAPNEELPTSSDYLTLKPYEVFGRAFSISEIRKSYGITAKCFEISAEYHDFVSTRFDSLSSVIKSNQLRICR
ncbi:hypothetical protein [Dyella monticola]|nr:hypothetical protein [Dyella monticola]